MYVCVCVYIYFKCANIILRAEIGIIAVCLVNQICDMKSTTCIFKKKFDLIEPQPIQTPIPQEIKRLGFVFLSSLIRTMKIYEWDKFWIIFFFFNYHGSTLI